jgi:hypothetical protein
MDKEYLSNSKCDQTFKNVLRNQPPTVIIMFKKNKYKEHVQRPFVNKILSGKKVDGHPYSKDENETEKDSTKIQQKYIKNYVQGHLKTNIDFKNQGVRNFNIRHPNQ